jgi:hypothetical protein
LPKVLNKTRELLHLWRASQIGLLLYSFI